ncbi:MAG TPA: hypothetical protein VJS47_02405 [Rhizomicrobium sp.]|nr:hypothetical protein [Rhizomicrobium sp.]
MVAQMIVRQPPICQHAPLAEKADGNIAMAGAGHRAIKGLQDAGHARCPRLGWIKMFAKSSIICQVSETPERQGPLSRQGRRGDRGRENTWAGVWTGMHFELQVPTLIGENDVGDFPIFNHLHPAGQTIKINA